MLRFRFLVVALLCVGAITGVGCGAARADKNRTALLRINVGMTKEQVLRVMDEPYKTEVYSAGESTREFWLYYTVNCTTTDSCFTPLCFENGILKGWGRNYYDTTIRSAQEIKQDITVHQGK